MSRSYAIEHAITVGGITVCILAFLAFVAVALADCQATQRACIDAGGEWEEGHCDDIPPQEPSK